MFALCVAFAQPLSALFRRAPIAWEFGGGADLDDGCANVGLIASSLYGLQMHAAPGPHGLARRSALWLALRFEAFAFNRPRARHDQALEQSMASAARWLYLSLTDGAVLGAAAAQATRVARLPCIPRSCVDPEELALVTVAAMRAQGEVGAAWFCKLIRAGAASAAAQKPYLDRVKPFLVDAAMPAALHAHAEHFRLLAAAGEHATIEGLTGWAPGAATSVVRMVFGAWALKHLANDAAAGHG